MIALELKLFFRRKLLLFLLVLVTLLGLSSSLFLRFRSDNAHQETLQYAQFLKDDFEHRFQELTNTYHSGQLAKEEYEEEAAFFSDYIQSKEKEIQAIEQEDWNFFYNQLLDSLVESGEIVSSNYEGYQFPTESIDNTVHVVRYLKEHQLATAFPLTVVATEFDQPKSLWDKSLIDQKGIQKLRGSSHSCWFWLKRGGILYPIAISLLALGNFFIKDRWKQNQQFKFLATSGLSTSSIGFYQWLTYFFLEGLLLLFAIGLPALIEALINGVGSSQYPITTYYAKDFSSIFSVKMKLVPLGQVLLQALPLVFCYTLLVLAFCHFCITLFKSPSAGVIIGLAGSYFLSLWVHKWNPFAYWDIGNVVDGSVILRKAWVQYSLPAGLISMLLATLLLYSGVFFMRKKG